MKFTSEGGWIYMILWCNARNQNKYTTLKENEKKIDKHKMRENGMAQQRKPEKHWMIWLVYEHTVQQ